MNRKNRFFVSILCLISLAFSSVFVCTAEEAKPHLAVEQKESYGAGEEVSVTLYACDLVPAIASLELQFTYDTNYLELLISPETGTYFEFGDSCKGFLSIGYQETMRVALVSMEKTLKPGKLVTLLFLVKEPIPENVLSPISVKVLSACDSAGNNATLVCENGGILGKKQPPPSEQPESPTDSPSNPEKIAYGDVNADQKIDAKDALMVLKSAVDKLTLSKTQALAAEVDGKEGINAKDALEILKFAVDKLEKFSIENEK